MLRLSEPVSRHFSRHLAAIAAAALWALAAASAVVWGLHWPRPEQMATAPLADTAPPSDVAAAAATQQVARALGQMLALPVQAPNRFQVLGVIASNNGQGSALLAIDAQPPQAFVQGQTVVEGWRLQFVGPEGVRLSSGPSGPSLELPLAGKP